MMRVCILYCVSSSSVSTPASIQLTHYPFESAVKADETLLGMYRTLDKGPAMLCKPMKSLQMLLTAVMRISQLTIDCVSSNKSMHARQLFGFPC